MPPSELNGVYNRVSLYIIYIYIIIILYLSVGESGPAGPCAMCKCSRLIEVQYNDVNAQRANVTASMKLCNTKLPV